MKNALEPDGLHIWIGTWNLQASSISPLDILDQWLEKGPAPDIVVVALQEVVELNAQSVFRCADGAPKSKVAHFTNTFEASMLRVWSHKYQMVRTCCMVGQLLTIYVRKSLMSSIYSVDADRVKSGVDGIFGNKGAVCIRFDVKDHGSVCFCNVHLASGVSHYEERKAHLRQLFLEAFQTVSQRDRFRKPKHGFRRAGIYKPHLHDACFVMGDFNFRLVPGHEDLLSRDQFLTGVSVPPWVQENFSEATITFPPTYKYVLGTTCFNEKRAPAWCDRILYNNLGKVQPICYDSVPEMIHTSDHRAVTGSFLWTVEPVGSGVTPVAQNSFDANMTLAMKLKEMSGDEEQKKSAHWRWRKNPPIHAGQISYSSHINSFQEEPTAVRRDSGREWTKKYNALFSDIKKQVTSTSGQGTSTRKEKKNRVVPAPKHSMSLPTREPTAAVISGAISSTEKSRVSEPSAAISKGESCLVERTIEQSAAILEGESCLVERTIEQSAAILEGESCLVEGATKQSPAILKVESTVVECTTELSATEDDQETFEQVCYLSDDSPGSEPIMSRPPSLEDESSNWSVVTVASMKYDWGT